MTNTIDNPGSNTDTTSQRVRADSTNGQLILIDSAEQYRLLASHDRLLPMDPQMLSSHRVDAHWAVAVDGQLTARCSLWWHETPAVEGRVVGLIGHYAAADDASASLLLCFVSDELAARGCTLALAPMDQNTWRNYRFLIEDDGRPPFFLEPTNSSDGPKQFAQHGFHELAWYFSGLVNDLTIRNPRLEKARARILNDGVTIRSLRQDEFEAELKKVYALAHVAFQDHSFYDNLSEADFLELYRPLRSRIPSDLILIAEHRGRVVGFCFAVPDLLQAERGSPIDTVIIKTFAVLPDRQYRGLGQVLLEEVQQRAASLGFQRGIHALVAEGGAVEKISRRYATPFRRYALFGKELSG